MKKIWPYVSAFFIGLSAGIVVAVKWLNEKTVFKGSVRIKQRGKGNEQMTDIRPEIDAGTAKNERKQARIIKRNEKRTKKAAKRLNKNS